MRAVRPLPNDCRDLVSPSSRGAIQNWQAFVELEHCDRIKRIKRVSELLPRDEQPLFFEGIVPASRLPSVYRTDIPVLRVVFPERTFFDTAKSFLRPEGLQIARLVAANLRKEPPDVSLFVAGHADARGSRRYNEILSIDRANSIAEEVFRAGINFSSIWRIGFGEDMPLVVGQNSYAWDRNRRIEFLFAAKPEAIAVWLADNQLDGLCQGRNKKQTDKCKAKLDLKTNYKVIEVVKASPRQKINPQRGKQETINPPDNNIAVAPTGSSGNSINPRRARGITINPKARSAGSISLNL